MSEFGGLIRDAREKLGLSPHRVAELIGRGTGIVKAWERGRAVPTDPQVVTSLAAVLALDERRLFEAAGLAAPESQPHLTIEQELATIAPPKVVAAPRDIPAMETPPVQQETLKPVLTEDPAPAGSTSATAPVSTPQPYVRPPQRTEPRTPPRTTQVQAPTSGSYMDDPEERWSYRLRAVWTAAGLTGLGVLLLWAGSRALGALGEAWDALLAGL
ncbi:MAG: helix-turn-helix domain-containing protein [Acidimicrobiia bacterium]|nr:helix-turn-helix domain-containing protein [Acidimicrobiia bacterium]